MHHLGIFTVVLSVLLLGCQSKSSLNRDISRLEDQHRRTSERLSSLQRDEQGLSAEISVIEKEKQHLDITANLVAGNNPNKSLATDLDTQERALNTLKKSWDRRSNSLIPQRTVGEQLEKLKQHNGPLRAKAKRLSAQVPDPITKASLAYRSTPSAASTQNNTPVWSTLRGILSRDFLPLWLILIASILLLWAITQHDFRRRYRAQRRAVVSAQKLNVISTSRALMRLAWINRYYVSSLVLVVLAVIALSSPRPSEKQILAHYKQALESDVNELEQSLHDTESNIQTLKDTLANDTRRLDERHKKNVTQLVNATVGPPAPDDAQGQNDIRDSLVRSHRVARSHLNHYLQSASYLQADEALLKQLSVDAKQQQKALMAFHSNVTRHERRLLSGKVGLLLLFTVANLGLVVRWQRKRAHRRFETENTCPMCLSHNSLQEVQKAETHSKETIGEPLRCSECKYLIDGSHRTASRLRIPTAGYTESGKTVWLTMFHRFVRQGGALAAKISLDRTSSPAGNDPVFDKILDALVKSRDKPAPTQIDRIQEPLLFDFSDGDRFFASNGILNLFDLGGDLFSETMEGNKFHKRAFQQNQGFLYFVDPTLDDEGTKQRQREQLAHFCEELRRQQNTRYGRPLPTPVAVCVSKIDLLESDNNGERFLKELTDLKKQKSGIEELVRRHQLTKKYQRYFFPGWELDDIFTKLVEGSFLFFPMSSFGIGNTGADIESYNFKPYGIVDPVLWLMHMNGYKAF